MGIACNGDTNRRKKKVGIDDKNSQNLPGDLSSPPTNTINSITPNPNIFERKDNIMSPKLVKGENSINNVYKNTDYVEMSHENQNQNKNEFINSSHKYKNDNILNYENKNEFKDNNPQYNNYDRPNYENRNEFTNSSHKHKNDNIPNYENKENKNEFTNSSHKYKNDNISNYENKNEFTNSNHKNKNDNILNYENKNEFKDNNPKSNNYDIPNYENKNEFINSRSHKHKNDNIPNHENKENKNEFKNNNPQYNNYDIPNYENKNEFTNSSHKYKNDNIPNYENKENKNEFRDNNPQCNNYYIPYENKNEFGNNSHKYKKYNISNYEDKNQNEFCNNVHINENISNFENQNNFRSDIKENKNIEPIFSKYNCKGSLCEELRENEIIKQMQKEEINRAKEFYDMILNFSNFQQLKNEGWDITWGKDGEIKYNNCKDKNNVVIGILGNKNRGKSFLLGRIIGKQNYISKNGFNVTTIGISANFPVLEENDQTNLITLDTAGKDNPLLDISNIKISDQSDNSTMSKKKKLDNAQIKEIARDQRVSEIVLSDFIIQESDVLITVLEQLSFAEQDMLKNLINQLKSKKSNVYNINDKKLLVIHNLMNFKDVKSINKFIENTLLNSLTFNIKNKEQPMDIFQNGKYNDTDKMFYVQKTDESDKLEIFHIIMGNDDSEDVRKMFNEPAIRFIKKVITTATSRKFKLIDKFVSFIIKNSKKYLNGNGFNENSIKINYEGSTPKSIILNQESNKEKPIDISLKGVFVDSKGINNFFATIEPDYSYNICLKDKKYYLEVTFEMFGKIENGIKTNISIQRNQHIITIEGVATDNYKIPYEIQGNLKYSEFYIQIIIDKFIRLKKNDSDGQFNEYHLAKIYDDEVNKKSIIDNVQFGIYHIIFPIKFIKMNKINN